MHARRGVLLGVVLTGFASACHVIAGIEDLKYTGSDGADGLPDGGSAYAAQVLQDSPLAYWRFDEKSGTTAVDSSGHGHDGQYVGAVTLGQPGAIAGDPGTAVGFDGKTAWMDAGDVFPFPGNAPCSLEAWVKPVTDSEYHAVISRNDGQGGTTSGYLIYIEPAADPAYVDFAHYLFSGGNQQHDIDTSSGTIGTSDFTHIVAVYDGTTLSLYLNGQPVGSTAGTISTPATQNPFAVGAESGGAIAWFNGPIDEVAVYGTPLSPARIQAHYNVGIGRTP
jgi:hypothetical protein